MKEIKLRGRVDINHRLTAEVPTDVQPGEVDLVLLLSQEQEDAAEDAWAAGIGREWAADWSDPREDIYTITDGEPVWVQVKSI